MNNNNEPLVLALEPHAHDAIKPLTRGDRVISV